MQKIYFFTLSLLSMLTILTPILGMEISSSIKMKTFMVDLYVREKIVNDTDNSLINDKHGCQVLGIDWQDNNKYKTDTADIYNADDPNNKWTWNMTHPTFLPLATIANKARFKGLEYVVLFPNLLPTYFVKKLKEEGPVTLTNTSFCEPVEIIVHLKTINKNGQTTYYDNLHFDPISKEELTSNTSTQSSDEPSLVPRKHNLKRKFDFSNKYSEILDEQQKTDESSHNPTTPPSYSYKKFISGTIAFVIIAYVTYLYRHNQLSTQFSSLINWLHLPFTNNKV